MSRAKKQVGAVVDRIENDLAVLECETGETLTWPLSLMPDGTKKGLCLRITVQFDAEGTLRREKDVSALHRKVFGPRENPGR